MPYSMTFRSWIKASKKSNTPSFMETPFLVVIYPILDPTHSSEPGIISDPIPDPDMRILSRTPAGRACFRIARAAAIPPERPSYRTFVGETRRGGNAGIAGGHGRMAEAAYLVIAMDVPIIVGRYRSEEARDAGGRGGSGG